MVVRETLSEEGTIWGLYIHTLGVVWNINYLGIVHTALCMECGPQLFGDSTLDYWGIVLGVELITGWECGVKKNILVERRGTFLGDICKEYDITATKHRPT